MQPSCNVVVIDVSSTAISHNPPNFRSLIPRPVHWTSDLATIIASIPDPGVRNQLRGVVTSTNRHDNDTRRVVFSTRESLTHQKESTASEGLVWREKKTQGLPQYENRESKSVTISVKKKAVVTERMLDDLLIDSVLCESSTGNGNSMLGTFKM